VVPSQLSPPVALAAVALVLLATGVSFWARLGATRDQGVAALRAVVQLAAVSLVIAAVLRSLPASIGFAAVMVLIAAVTSARRIGAARAWPWVAMALLTGVLPVLVIVFGSRSVPLTGAALVPFAGIVIGGAMTASSLTGRRCFAALREERGAFEAALSIGLTRSEAIGLVIQRHLPEALVPGLDQTRTVGLVTLPGAYVGVLLGGGSAVQAGTAQLLVLVGLMAAQVIVVVVTAALMRSGHLLAADLRELPA